MRNIHEVLKQKEEECAQLRHEIEALRIVAPLLYEKAASNRTVLHEKGAAEPSMRVAEEREERKAEPEIDVDRKGPLSTSTNETSWWKRAK